MSSNHFFFLAFIRILTVDISTHVVMPANIILPIKVSCSEELDSLLSIRFLNCDKHKRTDQLYIEDIVANLFFSFFPYPI